MQTLFELIEAEKDGLIAAILGHFFFVWIHPYVDGNGRTTRLLMNAIFVQRGYFWCVVRSENRDRYLSALEDASVNEDYRSFASLILDESVATFEKFKPW